MLIYTGVVVGAGVCLAIVVEVDHHLDSVGV